MESSYWQRSMLRGRIGRRKVLTGGGAALTAGVLAACGGGGSDTKKPGGGEAPGAQSVTTATAGAPKRGGVLHTYYTSQSPQLDVHKGADFTTTWVARIPYNGVLQLVEPTPGDVQVKPDLAESWEAVDAATYTFKLHKGVKFHNKPPVNAREFTAADVRANLQRLGSEKAYTATAANFRQIETIETPDNYTVRVKLKQPFATFPIQFGSAFGPSMVAPELFEGDLIARTMIGTGPFVLDSWDPPVGFKFSRNPDYFVKDRPYLDGVEHGVIPDLSRAVSAFQAGSVDAMSNFALPAVGTLKGVSKAVVQTFGGTGGSTVYFNLEKKPYSDLRVRQAIMYGIDPNEYLQVIAEGLVRRDGILSAGFTKYVWPESKLWKQDVKKAKDLLAAAGYPNGLDDEMIATPGTGGDFSTITQRQLRQIGVNIKLTPGDSNAWVARIINCDKFTLERWGYSAYETPDRYLYPYLHTGGSYTCWYHSPSMDALLDKGRATTKEEDAIKVYNDVQQEAYDNVAYVPVYSGVLTFAWQGYVKGLQPGIGEAALYRHHENVWIDKA